MSFMGSVGENEAETGLLRSYYNDLEDFAGEIAVELSYQLDRIKEAEGGVKQDSR